MRRPVLIAVTSDQHSGSQIGLCPSQGVRLDEGGEYHPNKAQLWLWDNWLDYHAKIAALRKALGAKLIYVCNGDALDGDHHGTSQIITRNQESQAYIAHEVFSVPKALKADAYYVVRGTTVHVGEGGATEEALAKHLRAERSDTDAWSVWHLRLDVHGRELDFQHHCTAGGQPWTAAAGIARLAMKHKMARIEAGIKPADLIIRSHIHNHLDSYDIVSGTRAIVTPPWQLKTSHGHKVAPENIPVVGGIAIVVQPDGEYTVKKYLYQPSLPQLRTVT